MKQLFSLLTTLLLSYILFAQDQNQNLSASDFNDETIYRLNILTPSLEIEKDVTKDISILANAGVGINYYYRDGIFGKTEGFIFPIQFELAGRYYTNFNRRIEKGRSIKNNSGNYVALSLVNIFETENDDVIVKGVTAAIPNYGIQRTYWKHFNLNFQTGLGYDFQQEEIVPQLILKLGYTF